MSLQLSLMLRANLLLRLQLNLAEVCETQTHLDQQAGLSGLLAVLQQGVGAPAREVVVEAVKGLEVVLTPRPAGHLPLKAQIRN